MSFYGHAFLFNVMHTKYVVFYSPKLTYQFHRIEIDIRTYIHFECAADLLQFVYSIEGVNVER